jgi:hypothetical protein
MCDTEKKKDEESGALNRQQVMEVSYRSHQQQQSSFPLW